MEQVFKMGMDISQIKAALAELESEAARIYAQPPPALNFGEVPPVPTDLGAGVETTLAQMARVQGQAEALLAQVTAAEGAAAAAAIRSAPENATLFGAATKIPFAPTLNVRPDSGQNLIDNGLVTGTEAEMNAQIAEAAKIKSQAKKEAAAGAKVEATEQERIAAATQSEFVTEEEIQKAKIDRLRTLRERNAVLQTELGLPIDQGAEGDVAAASELNAALKRQVTARNRAAASAEKEAAAAEARAALTDTYLLGKGSAAIPTAELRADAGVQASQAAEDRAIAVAFGKAKQEAYYEQVKFNSVFRNDLAQETALREARLGIEKQAIAAAEAANGGALRNDIVAGNVAQQSEAAIQKANTDEGLVANKEYIDAKQRDAVALQQEAAAVAEGNATNPEYIAAKLSAMESRVIEAEAVLAGTTEEFIVRQGELAAEQKLMQAKQRSAELEVLSTEENIRAKAATLAAEKEYKIALDKATADQLVARGITPVTAPGAATPGLFAGGSNGLLASAIPLAVGFAGISLFGSAFKEAEQLQRQMVTISDQLNALGKGDQIAPFKEGLLNIAANAGVASTQVAELGLRFQAAFGGDTTKALDNTQAAVEAMRITGQTASETVNTYEALVNSYQKTGITIRDVSDTAVGLSQRFGVAEKETIAFAAQLAPVAESAGFTAKQLETLGAVTAQATGKSATATADSFGRVIPELQKQAFLLVDTFEQAGKSDVAKQIAESFSRSDTAGAFNTLIKNFKELDEAQQKAVITAIAKPRDISSILPVFNNPDAYFNSLNATDEGKSKQRFEELQKTFGVQLGQLTETLKQFGISLFDSGVGQALGYLAQGAAGLVQAFGLILAPFKIFNDVLGGIPLTVVTIGLALSGLSAIFGVLSERIGTMIGVTAEDTAATAANSAAQAENTALRGENALVAEGQGVAVEGEAVAAGAAGAGRLGGARGGIFGLPASIIGGAKLGAAEGGGLAIGAAEGAALGAEAGVATKEVGLFSKAMGGATGAMSGLAEGLGSLAIVGAVLAIGVLIKTVKDLHDTAQIAEDDLKKKYLGEPDPAKRQSKIDQLNSMDSSVGVDIFGRTLSVPGAVSSFVTGYKTPQQLADELKANDNQKAAIAQGQALSDVLSGKQGLDLGIKVPDDFKKKHLDDINSLIDEVKKDPNNKDAQDRLAKEIGKVTSESIGTGDGLTAPLAQIPIAGGTGKSVSNHLADTYGTAKETADKELADAANTKKAQDDAKQAIDDLNNTLTDIKNRVDSGQISPEAGIVARREIIERIKKISSYVPGGVLDQKTNDELVKAEAENAKTISNRAVAATDLATKLNGFKGGADDPSAKIETLKSALNSGNLTNSDQSKVTDSLLGAYKELYSYELSHAKSLDEQLNLINNGIQIDPGTQAAVLKQQLSVGKLSDFAASGDQDQANVIHDGYGQIATIMVQTGKNVHEATFAYLVSRQAVAVATRQAAEDALNAAKATGGDTAAAQANLDKANRDLIAVSQTIDRLNQNPDVGNDTPITAVNPSTPADQAKQRAEAIKKSADGNAAYMKAIHDGDSVVQAQIDLYIANIHLANAITDDEKTAALTEIATANNNIKKSIQARSNSRFELLKALNADDPVAVAQIELQQAEANLAQSTPDNYNQNAAAVVTARNNIRKTTEATQQAYLAYLKQVFSNDPIKAAEISVQIAQAAVAAAVPYSQAYYAALAQLDAAQKEQIKAQESIDKSNLAYAAALVAGDPILAAQAAKQKAEYELAHAKTVEETNQALIDNLNADKSTQDALSKLYDSQSELLKASANYVGDTVAVAQIGVAEATRHLAEVQAKYAQHQAGDADVQAAKAALINANATARDANIKKLEDDYKFQLDMGQITQSQYISYLEGLKSLADGNTSIIRDLDLQIHNLKQALGANLQFNLPANIGLGTFYEARRLNQSVGPNGAAAGYQDNRQVSIQVVVNNGMDVTQVKQVLGDALGGGRFGNDLRRY